MASKRIVQGLVMGITLLGIASVPFFSGKGRQALAASTQQDLPVQDPLIQEGLNRPIRPSRTHPTSQW